MRNASTRYATPELPFVRSSDTSVAASEAAEEIAGTVRARVLLAVRRAGARGLTDEELIDHLGGNPNTLRPRRVELTTAGLIYQKGERPTRAKRRSGQPFMAAVWVAADEEYETLREAVRYGIAKLSVGRK